jgi:hypothetical protein
MHSAQARSTVRSFLVPLIAVALVSCSDGDAPLSTRESVSSSASLQDAAKPAGEELARILALSLQDPSARAMLYAALKASVVKEGKLHLEAFLRADGAPLLAGMAAAGGASEEQVFDLLQRVGTLEAYLPVPEHRARWSGGADLVIATQLEEDEVPFGVDLSGRPVRLSLSAPPASPTLVIVPAESFDERGRPLKSSAAPVGLGEVRPGAQSLTAPTTWTGVWINEVHVGDLHEPWTRGSPEFEMHLDNATADPRTTLVCAEEDLSVEPYRWDMDGEDYYNPFLMAQESEIPPNAGLVIHMWEDDDTRCVLKVYNASDYVRLTTDYLKAIADIYKGVLKKNFVNGRWVMKVFNAYIAARALINGGDDFVGVAAGLQRIDEIPKTFVLKDQNGTNQGTIEVQWRSVTID